MTTKNKEFIEKLTSIKEAVDLAAKDIAKELDFDKAMLTAQSLMPNLIEGSGKNPHFSSDYIKFEQLIAVTRYVLLPLGLRFKQVGHVLEGNDPNILSMCLKVALVTCETNFASKCYLTLSCIYSIQRRRCVVTAHCFRVSLHGATHT